MSEARHPLLASLIDDVVILGSLHELPLLIESVRPHALRQSAHVQRTRVGRTRIADHVADRDAQSIGERSVEPSPLRWRLDDERIHVPILGFA